MTGLPTPPAGWLLGCDVSVFQAPDAHGSPVDVPALMAGGCNFLYIRATDGLFTTDPTWEETAHDAVHLGLPFGGYGVLEPYGSAKAAAQAAAFCERVRDSGATLPPWLDFELAKGLSAVDAVRSAALWCDEVEARLGMRVMVYCGPAFIAQLDQLGGTADDEWLSRLAVRPLAVAHYGVASPRVPRFWDTWAVWQMGQGTIPGTSCAVDVDYFRGTVEELVALGSLDGD